MNMSLSSHDIVSMDIEGQHFHSCTEIPKNLKIHGTEAAGGQPNKKHRMMQEESRMLFMSRWPTGRLGITSGRQDAPPHARQLQEVKSAVAHAMFQR